ncbi:Spy/CpxP family protein refolding chaperone [Massilia sp. SM-13]|uniref:Spy/CpxP family protein refolding chaperone n=1 Tax=Pseudoduganella rhizocola TaxID=3382643 RepID=UPI0038B4FC3D
MNKAKLSLQGLLLAAVMAAPFAAIAGDGPGHSGPPRGAPHRAGAMPGPGPDGEPPFMRGLGLTEAQEDKVFAILHAQAPYLREQGKAHERAERALDEMHDAGKFDDAAAVKLAQASAQAIANITLQHLRTEQKLLAVLTPEQRQKLQDRQPPRPPQRESGEPQ